MSATTRQGGTGGRLSITVTRDGDARVVLAGTLGPLEVPGVRDELAVLLRDVDRVLVDPAPAPRALGLGLRLVDAVAAKWGFEAHRDGKTAWARLPR